MKGPVPHPGCPIPVPTIGGFPGLSRSPPRSRPAALTIGTVLLPVAADLLRAEPAALGDTEAAEDVEHREAVRRLHAPAATRAGEGMGDARWGEHRGHTGRRSHGAASAPLRPPREGAPAAEPASCRRPAPPIPASPGDNAPSAAPRRAAPGTAPGRGGKEHGQPPGSGCHHVAARRDPSTPVPSPL